MSEEKEEEEAEEHDKEEEIVLFSFQRIASGQRKEKTKQSQNSTKDRKEVRWKAAWSAHFLCPVSAAASHKGMACDFGLCVQCLFSYP